LVGTPRCGVRGQRSALSLPLSHGASQICSLVFVGCFCLDRRVPAADNGALRSAIGQADQDGGGAFVTTHWSVVLTAQGQSPAAQEALEKLCRSYWRPLYEFVRRQGCSPEEAEDITQGFFALLLERKDFQAVRQEKGRLRSFLLASLKHFMANERRNAATLKRGGGRTIIPLEGLRADDCREFDRTETLSADRLFDRRWAFSVLERVFARLREESKESVSAPLLERLTKLLSDEPDQPSQTEIAREFRMSGNAVKQAFHRLRRRYRQLLREEVAHTVATPAEIEDELRDLIAAIRS